MAKASSNKTTGINLDELGALRDQLMAELDQEDELNALKSRLTSARPAAKLSR